MTSRHPFSRRGLIRGGGALAAAAAFRTSLWAPAARAAVTADKPALLVVYLAGGYNSLFSSADSFVAANTFGVSSTNTQALGGGLVVDKATYGTLDPFSLGHMATVGMRHGVTNHAGAQAATMTNGTHNVLLQLAAAIGGDAAIKAAVVGSNGPPGPRTAEGAVSLQSITDMKSTIAALGGLTDPTIPDRKIAMGGLTNARAMSASELSASPQALTSVTEGYQAGIDTLSKPVQQFDYTALATAYGISPTATSVSGFTAQMVAAELMITAGANVVFARDSGWDTHGDRDGAKVRTQMNSRILPGLRTFLKRMIEAPGRNVVVAIMGEFARSLPGSDHAASLSPTVIGKRVKVGTTGRVNASVQLPTGSPGALPFWAYVANTLDVASSPFGPNPHTSILL